ncbi:hypothetical protein J7K43_04020, partial [Candidatus Calescamantes bacterium]|nr:hypothetical protein [Candidatus Calescamantes bacterium]
MDISTGLIRKLEKVEPHLREVLVSILEEIEKQREERVTRKESQELRDVVKELAQAQRKTEERLTRLEETVEKLAEAQRKTEERVNELAEAQRRTEERLTRLEETVEKLAEAQRKTEERVNELAEAQRRTEERLTRLEETVEKLAQAQRRTEERVNELAQAQRRTEEEIARLTGEVITLKKEVGGLAHTVGYRLEDEAMKALPEILKKEMNLGIMGRLRRDFIETKKGKFVEVNIWGEGKVDGKDYIIIGEA